MKINKVILAGFRNFLNTTIKFSSSSLVIGSNDIGKTNLMFALRLLLDKSLSERDIEPSETDFHVHPDGTQEDYFSITIYFESVTEDAVLSILKGHVSSTGETILQFTAKREDLSHQIYVGFDEFELEEVTSRFYLKYINLRYVTSQRDLNRFIDSEKKQLLKLSQESNDEPERQADMKQMSKISRGLEIINERVRRLNYVKNSTSLVNDELQKLAHNYTDYSIHLDSGAIKVHQFIDNLRLAATNSGSKITLGGDGRNNQILMALWKAKSQRESDPEHEVIFYCVEEPEAHLHPHQQRKLADYLINELPGQTIITSHSPQITARYSPDSIINLISRDGSTKAASGGCSPCISDKWDQLGYRMSIIPAEAFYSSCVFLVEGPSEVLFYTELCKQIGIDLDFFNISILSVDGIQFQVYADILNAMEIPWVMRTDNDVTNIKIKEKYYKNLAGINRCLSILGLDKLEHAAEDVTSGSLLHSGTWERVSLQINPQGVFLSKIDLENDLASELPEELKDFSGKDNMPEAVAYLQEKKAIRMRGFLAEHNTALSKLQLGELIKPITHCLSIVRKKS